jgi:ubiquinone/menaquinone biosynthesis C-methylase UbiE
MEELRDRVNRFFDNDAAEYLEKKYIDDKNSFMNLRKIKATWLVSKYMVPRFHEEFRVLDVGCGPGILFEIFSQYNIAYFGIDISMKMLCQAKQQASPKTNLAQKYLLRGDVEDLPFRSDSFNAAVCLGVIEYLAEDDRLLSELARILKPEGYLLIAVTNKYSYNLAFERLIEYLRRSRAAACLNKLKMKRGLGHFKQTDFLKRRHSPDEFRAMLHRWGFMITDSVFWGFNVLPYPLNHLCVSGWNELANANYDKTKQNRFKLLGEGYLALAQKGVG